MLPRQLKEIQFGAGLSTRGDERAQQEQLLDIGVNVEFDDVGDLRCRYPFDTIRSAVIGGGTLANARRLALLDDELLCFTVDSLYAWIPAESAWQFRATHLAIATDEQTVFAGPGDEFNAERAEFQGHIIYAWQVGLTTQIAVVDEATGAVVVSPTKFRDGLAYDVVRPKLVVLDNAVMILTTVDGGANAGVFVSAITLAPFTISQQTAFGAPFIAFTGATSATAFDAVRVPGQDRMYVVANNSGPVIGTTSGYTIADCDEGFRGTSSAVSFSDAFGPIACAVDPAAAVLVVAHGQRSSTNVFAETYTVTPAANPVTFLNAATLGTYGTGAVLSQLTAAFRLTQDAGAYRCYAFWSCDESSSAVFECRTNWIDTGARIGTEAPFVYALGIGSKAFARDSHVYVWGTFGGLSFASSDPTGTHSELQNTYYLYRDDALLLAKAVWGEGVGLNPPRVLPTVTGSGNAFAFMGGIRRLVPVGSNATNPVTGTDGYAERAPREISFTFDDDRARRCVQFGASLYVLGGLLLQYDGTQLTEVGFTTYPWLLTAVAGFTGVIPAAGYSYKATDRWTNGKGEVDRSTTATVANYTLAAANSIVVKVPNLYVTRKSNVAIEVWRTEAAPPSGAPFFLVTGQDPTLTTGNNAYIVNSPTSITLASVTDNLTDPVLRTHAASPENGAVLSSLEPPPATIAYADDQRIYLAGVPAYPNRVYYSQYRQPGLVATFSDALAFDVPTDGGTITALGSLDGTLIVWCATATYAFAGAGNDNTGGGTNFQLARILSTDLGCVSQEARALFDDGFMVKTAKGWFVLTRKLTYEYVGTGPYRYDSETVYGMTVLTARHQIRILTSGRMLVYDTLVNQWAESSVTDGLDLLMWSGLPVYLTATGPRPELGTWTGYAGTDYSLTLMDIEPGWIKFGSLQSRVIVDFVQLLGEFRSACVIRKRLAKNYEATTPGAWAYHTDQTWTPTPGTVGSALQVRQSPRWKRCEAIKARFTITAPDGVSPLGGPCARLTSITLSFAAEPNAYGAISASQKQ